MKEFVRKSRDLESIPGPFLYLLCDHGKLSKYLSLSIVNVETIVFAVLAITHNNKGFAVLE